MNEKSNGTVLLEWKRTRGEVARLVLQEFNGQDLLQLRVFYTDEKGEPKPTPKGVTIPHNQIAPLRKALRKAEEKLNTKAMPEGQPVKPNKKKSNWGSRR